MPRFVPFSQRGRIVLNMNAGGASERYEPSNKDKEQV